MGRVKKPEEKERLRDISERYLGARICPYDELIAGAVSLVKLIEKDYPLDQANL